MADSIRRRTRAEAKEEEAATKSDVRNTVPPDTVRPTSPLLSASSSFFSVPTVTLTGVGLFPPFDNTAGRHAYEFVCQHFAYLQGSTCDSARHLLEALLTASNDRLVVHIWAILQASVFKRKTALSTIPYFAVATVLNHARRTFWFGDPAVGFFVLPQPDEDWRLLLARPDVFLEDVVKAVRGGGLLVAVLQKRVWDIFAGGMTAALLTADEATLTKTVSTYVSPRVARTVCRRAKDIATTLFVVWLFTCIEFAVAQASATLAIGSAVWRVSQKHPELLSQTLFGGSLATTVWVLLLTWLQMVVYPLTGLVPLVVRSVLRPRQPGVFLCLLFLVTAMDILLRYRSRLYIAIETSGLFVFLGFTGISVLMVTSERGNTKTMRP